MGVTHISAIGFLPRARVKQAANAFESSIASGLVLNLKKRTKDFPYSFRTTHFMTLFKTRGAAIYGIDAHLIDVEVDMFAKGNPPESASSTS